VRLENRKRPLGPSRVRIPPPPLTTRIPGNGAGSSRREAGLEPASPTARNRAERPWSVARLSRSGARLPGLSRSPSPPARLRGVPRPIHCLHGERVRSARRGMDEVFVDSGRDGERAENTVDVDLVLDRETAGRCRRSTASSQQMTWDNRNCPRCTRWQAPRAA
jgi:hypothetical protein